jgi:hypothetical protein
METFHPDVEAAFPNYIYVSIPDPLPGESPQHYNNFEWKTVLKAEMLALGFVQSTANSSIFIHPSGTIITVYVDDILILSKREVYYVHHLLSTLPFAQLTHPTMLLTENGEVNLQLHTPGDRQPADILTGSAPAISPTSLVSE